MYREKLFVVIVLLSVVWGCSSQDVPAASRTGSQSMPSVHKLPETEASKPTVVVSRKVRQSVSRRRAVYSGRMAYGDATYFSGAVGSCGRPLVGLYAAMRDKHSFPCGSRVRVTYNGRSVDVVILDSGPYGPGRIIDLCPAAFSRLAPLSRGVLHGVKVRRIS